MTIRAAVLGWCLVALPVLAEGRGPVPEESESLVGLSTRAALIGVWELEYVSELHEWARFLVITADGFRFCPDRECSSSYSGQRIDRIDDFFVLEGSDAGVDDARFVLAGSCRAGRSFLFGARFHQKGGNVISAFGATYAREGDCDA